MKVFVVLATILLVVNAADEYCSSDVVRACKSRPSKRISSLLPNCTAKYGAIDKVLPDLQTYVNTHITKSFEYLLMSTHFANFEKNRLGFEKILRKLSDEKWDDAINLLKYIGKRGGIADFNKHKQENINQGEGNGNYEMYELESMAKALDIEKDLAMDGVNIHERVSGRHNDVHDPEVMSYIEEHFAHKHADCIRDLAGHVADLNKLLSGEDNSLALFLFDEYLQKS